MIRAGAALPAVLGIVLASCAAAPAAQSCRVTPYRFDRTASELRAGRHVVRFENADAAAPTAWEGPVAVYGPDGARRCSVATEGLISGPLLVYDGSLLVLATFSGSNHRIETIDLEQCRHGFVSAAGPGPITVADGQPRAAGRPVPGFRCGPTP